MKNKPAFPTAADLAVILVSCFCLLLPIRPAAGTLAGDRVVVDHPDQLFVQQLMAENDKLLAPAPRLEAETTTLASTFSWSYGGIGFIHALIASFSIIIVTELGDKTFFIAAIMSMQHSKLVVFAGALLALTIMTVLSCLLGLAATIIPHQITYYLATILFAVFGVKMLYDAWKMRPEEAEGEYDETEIELRQRHVDLQRTFASSKTTPLLEAGLSTYPSTSAAVNSTAGSADSRVVVVSNSSSQQQQAVATLPWKLRILKRCGQLFSLTFLEALTLTFVAEWGDRSQISTIALAAKGENFWGVNIGACVGHAMCTGLACVGGSLIAKKISPKQVMIVGGVLFLAFALYNVVSGVPVDTA